MAKQNFRSRKPRFEQLEERTLLAVSAGNIPQDIVPGNAAKVTWVVNTIEDPASWDTSDAVLSLREALDSANKGDTIVFSSALAGQTITLCGSELNITKQITIDASSIGGMTINADQKSRGFNISIDSEDEAVEIININVTGGNTNNGRGGGINADTHSMLTLTNCTISGNTASSSGGGINVNTNSTLILANCTITGNSSSFSGGGIHADESTLTLNECTIILTNCTISGNTTTFSGGGIYAEGIPTFTNCTISENSGGSYGGGIHASAPTFINCTIFGNTSGGNCGGGIHATGTSTFTNCVISGNSASNSGGGIRVTGTSTFTNCTISGNTSNNTGGGIFADKTSTFIKCIFSGNTASDLGGGIYAVSSTFTNCTITGNTASRYGGGIYAGSSILTNCTVAGNTASRCGGGIYICSKLYCYNSIIAENTADISGSDIFKDGTVTGCNTLSSFSSWSYKKSTFIYDSTKPLFKSAETGDYTLAENSQAIDKGNNEYVKTADDLAGNTRIVNGIVDLGAYEYQGASLETPAILTGTKGRYVSYGANNHRIEWRQVENAAGYEIAYSSDNKTWKTVTADAAADSAVITGLTYGASVTYKLRALDTVPACSSDWTDPITFLVCPMDINNDGDIAGADRSLLAACLLTSEGDEGFLYAADINGDGDIAGADRNFLSSNWLLESNDPDVVFPNPLAAPLADAVFTTTDIF